MHPQLFCNHFTVHQPPLAQNLPLKQRVNADKSMEAPMLNQNDAVANVAVKDLNAAKKFYENTLGLTVIDTEGDEVVVYKSGHSSLNVYRSRYAGTNKATAVTWDVGGRLEEIVKALQTKGVKFEHYDLPGLELQGDVHVGGGMKVAWFKDPDGNILNLVSHDSGG